MRKERKETLLYAFPPVPDDIMQKMQTKNKYARNYAVMLTRGDELFVRCFHQYCKGALVERQRYVFAKDGCCRYGSKYGTNWQIRTEFREPVFCLTSYGYNFDNSYTVLNFEAINKSCMKYSCAELYNGTLLMEYMQLYCKHPNVEYLMKTGYDHLVEERDVGYYWSVRKSLGTHPNINWKTNDLLKMLGLNRAEFKALRGSEGCYDDYLHWREKFPKYNPEELLAVSKVFKSEYDTAEKFCKVTGIRLTRLARYLSEQNVRSRDYSDYLDQCRMLNYDLHDTAICMPHDFEAMHTRLSAMISYKQNAETRKLFEEHYADRKKLEFSSGKLLIRQPETLDEIAAEGAGLHHCVGGYGERHAQGKLHILFIRKMDKPDKAYYTMELGLHGEIRQVRGLRNCDPTKEVRSLIEQYKHYLDGLFAEKKKKARKTA